MSNLIPVFNSNIQNEKVQLVDAKLLHSFLEVETRFNDWIDRRIKEYEFIENQDFILITQKRVTKTRGGDRRSKDFHITLDMAKELSMIERTEKGRQARKYFIECEKTLLKSSAVLHSETIHTLTLTDKELHCLACLYKYANRMREHIELIRPALTALGSRYEPSFISMSLDYKLIINKAKQILKRETGKIQLSTLSDERDNILNILK